MTINSLPQFSVSELNASIGTLLERAFSPKFILNASISQYQKKKGHLWLTLTDDKASITGVIWSSALKKITYEPSLDDGVIIIGRLNFWTARASINVQILDIRPSLSTVFRKFEIVKNKLEKEGLIDINRRRKLPNYPKSIAIMTSSPSSALADIEKTALERWPLAKLIIIPIPVQGAVESSIKSALSNLSNCYKKFNIEAIVLARGGGSREDLSIFDSETLCRELSLFPVPVVTGIGHENDLTVADLVADCRSSTPTAAIISLLPSRDEALAKCIQKRKNLWDYSSWIISKYRKLLNDRKINLGEYSLTNQLSLIRGKLIQRKKLLNAFSPNKILSRGFSIIKGPKGELVSSVNDVSKHDQLSIYFVDGKIVSLVESIKPNSGD